MATWPLVVLAGMFGVVAVVAAWQYLQLPGSIVWRARRSREREDARLRQTPTTDLLSEAREAVRSEQWEKFAAARILLQDDQWTDEKLLRVLEQLVTALEDDDKVTGRSGRQSHFFEFHDCGLASICEALQKRIAGTTGQIA